MNTYCKGGVLLVLAAGMAVTVSLVMRWRRKVRFNNLNTAYCNKLAPKLVSDKTVICRDRQTYRRVRPMTRQTTADNWVGCDGSGVVRRVEFAALVDVQGTSVAKQAFNSALFQLRRFAAGCTEQRAARQPGVNQALPSGPESSSVLGGRLFLGRGGGDAECERINADTAGKCAESGAVSGGAKGHLSVLCSDGTMGCNGQALRVGSFSGTKISGSAALKGVSRIPSQAVSGTVMGAPSMSTTQTSTTQSATALIQNSSSRLSSFYRSRRSFTT